MRLPTTRQIFGQSVLYGLGLAAGGAIGRVLAGHVWFNWLMWIAGVGVCLLAALVAIRFRLGDARFIDWMDQDGPETVRLLPILGIPIAVLFLPFLLTLGVLFAWPPVLSHWAVGSMAFGLAAWALAALGIIKLMAYRPPLWLIPPWVLAHDPYAPIELRTYRRSLLIGGVLSLLMAGLAIAVAMWIYVVQF